MDRRIFCSCGEVLVEEVTDAGVRPPGADEVFPFRRTTDYVVCAACMLAYDVRSLMARSKDVEVIAGLERLADLQRPGSPDQN